MQPTNPQRPVMDISAPHRPVPAPAGRLAGAAATPPPGQPSVQQEPAAPSLPVREAPASSEPEPEAQAADAKKPDEQPAKTDEHAEAAPGPTPTPASAPARPHDKSPLPVGAILGAVFGMAALSVVAILIYLNT